MELRLILALVAGVLYWYGSQNIFYCFMEGFSWLPLMHAVVYGAITGRMAEALIIGASISALYISLVAAGGNTPADCAAAGTIAIACWVLGSNFSFLGSIIFMPLTSSACTN